jgi:hypothetical protein
MSITSIDFINVQYYAIAQPTIALRKISFKRMCIKHLRARHIGRCEGGICSQLQFEDKEFRFSVPLLQAGSAPLRTSRRLTGNYPRQSGHIDTEESALPEAIPRGCLTKPLDYSQVGNVALQFAHRLLLLRRLSGDGVGFCLRLGGHRLALIKPLFQLLSPFPVAIGRVPCES